MNPTVLMQVSSSVTHQSGVHWEQTLKFIDPYQDAVQDKTASAITTEETFVLHEIYSGAHFGWAVQVKSMSFPIPQKDWTCGLNQNDPTTQPNSIATLFAYTDKADDSWIQRNTQEMGKDLTRPRKLIGKQQNRKS